MCWPSGLATHCTRRLSAGVVEEKAGLVQAHVAPEKLRAYQALAHGQFMRPHGLETFSCEIAGLPVDRSNVKY
jgi:hypothetical protein